jgi:hypothetical protein
VSSSSEHQASPVSSVLNDTTATMKGLLTHSNFSVESVGTASQRPPSIMSFATTTSVETVQGIGTLSGRMIYAVGDVALRGIDLLVLRRRLGKVILAFPHQDDIVTNDIETIYDDTLEFSRYCHRSIFWIWLVLKCG